MNFDEVTCFRVIHMSVIKVYTKLKTSPESESGSGHAIDRYPGLNSGVTVFDLMYHQWTWVDR